MGETNVLIKKMDEHVFRRFKAEAIREGLTVSKAAQEALEQWTRSRRLKGIKDVSRMRRAAEHMDATRTPSGDWDAVREIRRWRDTRARTL
jgi:negative regulator of sigma E activity